MKTVFILQHAYERNSCGCDEIKFIGVYTSEQAAKAAVKRLSTQPGFKERSADFHISKYELDKDHWTEGFVTIE